MYWAFIQITISALCYNRGTYHSLEEDHLEYVIHYLALECLQELKNELMLYYSIIVIAIRRNYNDLRQLKVAYSKYNRLRTFPKSNNAISISLTRSNFDELSSVGF